MSEQPKHASGDLSLILAAIGTACKAISSAVRRAGLIGLFGLEGATNATGDDVKKLDVISDEIFVNSLRHTRRVALMVSEERAAALPVEGCEGAKYIVAFDPLDGSSNIDCVRESPARAPLSHRQGLCRGRGARALTPLTPGPRRLRM